jgi:hypothetical protein
MVEFLGGIKEYKMRKWKYSADDYKACADEGLTLSEPEVRRIMKDFGLPRETYTGMRKSKKGKAWHLN